MTPEERSKFLQEMDAQPMHQCGCVGPQNGQPLCPCRMRGVKVVSGRWMIPARDLGPVTDPKGAIEGMGDLLKGWKS